MDIKGTLTAVVTAFGICVVNTGLGYAVSRYAFSKDLNVFLALVFGSLGVRAIVIIAAAWFCLSVLGMHQVAFSLTFAISSFLLLLGEILFFHKSFETAKRRQRPPVTDFLKKKTPKLTIRYAYT